MLSCGSTFDEWARLGSYYQYVYPWLLTMGVGQALPLTPLLKAAVLTFTKGLAKEAASQGITVNCLAPGLINTAFHDVHTAPPARQNMITNTPLAREGQPLDVAGPVLFLVSELAAFITGETININSGQRMN